MPLSRLHRPLLALVVVAVLGLAAGPVTWAKDAPPAPEVASAKALGIAIADVAARAKEAVVFIRVEARAVPAQNVPFGLPFAVPQGPVPREGQGSGFVISDDGLVLTNAHVVKDAEHITVRFADGRELDAKAIGSDENSDVAVLRIDGEDFPHLQLADSDHIRVGEWVVAVGSPFGLAQTVTAGIVSAKGRNAVGINALEDFIQTDAAINPGNSGGPLLDLDGRVVGITSAIFSRSGGYMGIGFAVPSNLVRTIAAQLEENGTVSRGFLGVGIQDLTPDLARAFGTDHPGGALVSEVQPGGAAAAAGLEVGDVVVAVDGRPIQNGGALRNAVSLKRPGSVVHLALLRQGNAREVEVRLGARSEEREGPEAVPSEAQGLGFQVAPLDEALRKRLPFPVERGLVVSAVAPDGAAARAGLRPGTVILDVDREPVDDVPAFEKRIAAAKGGSVLLRVLDPRGTRWIVLRVS